MLIKDQLLLQHISYKVRGYFVLKKHCQYFQRKLRQFSVDITSHHNFLRISSELSSEVCENYRTCLKISSEWTDQNFSRNLSRYQPQTLGISSGFSDTSPEDQHKFLRMSHDIISPKFSEDNVRNLL